MPLSEVAASAVQSIPEIQRMKKAVEVKALNDHRIWLRFADGVEGEVDLSHLAGRGVFRAWADRKVFENVHVDGSGAIVWNEELDLSGCFVPTVDWKNP
jgi:hypothetical protein